MELNSFEIRILITTLQENNMWKLFFNLKFKTMIIEHPITHNKYYFNWDNDACILTILMAAVEPIYGTPILVYLCPHPDRLSDWEIEQADKECQGWRENLPNIEDWD